MGRDSVRRWTPTKRRRFLMRSKMGSLGWIQTQRQMLKKSRRNTRRLRAFVRQSFPSTMVLAAVAAVAVEPRRMRRKHTMSCRKADWYSRVDMRGHVETRVLLNPNRTFVL